MSRIGDPPLSKHLLGAVAAALLAAPQACAGGPELDVTLVTLPTDTPWDTVTSVELVVTKDGQRIGHATAQASSREVLAPNLASGGRLEVIVYGRDAQQVVTSRGHAQVDVPDDGRCCIELCFCTLGVDEAGACGCAREGCGSC